MKSKMIKIREKMIVDEKEFLLLNTKYYKAIDKTIANNKEHKDYLTGKALKELKKKLDFKRSVFMKSYRAWQVENLFIMRHTCRRDI